MVDVDIDTKDLLKALHKFPENVQKNIMNGAIRSAAAGISKAAKQRAPAGETGLLKKSIGVVKRRSKSKNIVSFSVTPRLKKEHGYIGYFHEFGTSKMAAHPFMRPAFEAEGPNAIGFVRAYMKKRIDKEIEKSKR